MSGQHTPGPWKRAGELATHILSADGKMVADAPHHNDMPTAEGFANAHLIASSPELLEMLMKVRKWGGVSSLDQLDEMDALIAKATGKEGS